MARALPDGRVPGRGPGTPGAILLLVFVLALGVRLGLLMTVWDDLRHGTAALYGSTAVGLTLAGSLSFQPEEIERIEALPDNISGDYLSFYQESGRRTMTEFLPGPAVLTALLWRVFPSHNFLPYLVLQSLLDALLIVLFLAAMSARDRIMAWLVTILMVLNLGTIRRTLMMGYDFWPQFATMALFTGVLWGLHRRKGPAWYLLPGIAAGLAVWFRGIVTFLSFFVAGAMFLQPWFARAAARRRRLLGASLLLLPVVLAIGSLMLQRLDLTGNPRPTRSTLWHTFFAGVGQFDNPYGLESDDRSVWQFAQRLSPELRGESLGQMYSLPDSPYEKVLRAEATVFIREHPLIFLRNIAYRIGIMISPLLYSGGDLIPARAGAALRPIGFLAIPLWLIGMLHWYRRDRLVFVLAATTYLYFFLAFSWLYVAGRVILPFVFVAFLIYLGGLREVLLVVGGRRGRPGRREAIHDEDPRPEAR